MVRLVIILSTLLLVVSPAWAEALVQGRYVAGGDTTVLLHITVQRPAPVAFIVMQKMAPGLSLLEATPPPVGGPQGRTTVKWLFKRPSPGQFVVNMQFGQPVAPGQLEGSISYRHPGNGSFVLSRIEYYPPVHAPRPE